MTIPVPAVLPDTPLTVPQLRYKFAPRSLAGMGQTQIGVDESGNPIYDYGGGDVGTSTTTLNVGDFSWVDPSTGKTSPVNMTQLLNTIIKGGLDIVKLTTLPSGVVVQTPGGTLLRQAPGLPVPASVIGATGVLGAKANVSTGAGLAIAAVLGIAALVLVLGRR